METIVYVMPIVLDYELNDLRDMSDEELIATCYEDGRSYSLKDFEEAFTENEVTPFIDYIRFINV